MFIPINCKYYKMNFSHIYIKKLSKHFTPSNIFLEIYFAVNLEKQSILMSIVHYYDSSNKTKINEHSVQKRSFDNKTSTRFFNETPCVSNPHFNK